MTDQPNALLDALEPILQAIAKSGKIEAVDRHSIAVALTFSRPTQPSGEALRDAVYRFLSDYDDSDRADAGSGPLMELHIASFREALATRPAHGADERETMEVMASAFAKAFYGPAFDPFTNPEAYDLIEQGMRAAIDAKGNEK